MPSRLERFRNNAATTLNGAITAAATTLTVTSAAAFPTAGEFRLLIEAEILLVTAVAGAVFTVTRGAEGTTAAAHASLVAVEHVLTMGALDSYVSPLVPQPRLAKLLLWNADPAQAASAALAATSTVNYAKLPLPNHPLTITNVHLYVGTAGATPNASASLNAVGLYNAAGTQLNATTGLGTTFSSVGAKKIALSAAVTLAADDDNFIWVALLAAYTTMPQFLRTSSISGHLLGDFAAGEQRWLLSPATVTALPASFTPSTQTVVGTATFVFGLS